MQVDSSSNNQAAELAEYRYRFFSGKYADVVFEQDRILVTLFSGVIAGLLALLVARNSGYLATLLFLLAALAAIVGLATCLLHMALSAKVLGFLAAMLAREEIVPNLVSREEPTQHALKKTQAIAQMCYVGQLLCLFWSAVLAAIGVLASTWDVVGFSGLVVCVLVTAALAAVVCRPMLLVYRRAKDVL